MVWSAGETRKKCVTVFRIINSAALFDDAMKRRSFLSRDLPRVLHTGETSIGRRLTPPSARAHGQAVTAKTAGNWGQAMSEAGVCAMSEWRSRRIHDDPKILCVLCGLKLSR